MNDCNPGDLAILRPGTFAFHDNERTTFHHRMDVIKHQLVIYINTVGGMSLVLTHDQGVVWVASTSPQRFT